MEQIYFGERIAGLRRQFGLTQEGLAQKLGVTNQAVSKWESDQCCPDIMLLPALADVFGISMDTLFGRTAPSTAIQAIPVFQGKNADKEVQGSTPSNSVILPWEDNADIHAVCFQGHRLMDSAEIPTDDAQTFSFGKGFSFSFGSRPTAELHFSGEARDVHSAFAVTCKNAVIHGSIHAGNGVECGDVGGNVEAGDGVECGNVGGNVTAGDGVACKDVCGHVQAGDGVGCGNVLGNITAGDDVSCGNVEGSVKAGGDVHCGDVGGSVEAEGDVNCGDIGGHVR